MPQTATPAFPNQTASLLPARDAVVTLVSAHQLDAPPPPEDQARADCYSLAARLLLAPPDAGLLQALANTSQDDMPGHVRFEDSTSGRSPDTAWQRLAAAALVMPTEAVRDEFAALFEAIGKPLIDPYASLYVAGFMMEKPLAALRSDLAALGLARTTRASVPEDHLGALCETMRLLIAGAPGLPPAPPAAQRAFFARHLEPWAGRCLDDIENAAPANFYRCVADYVRQLLQVEGQILAMVAEPRAAASA